MQPGHPSPDNLNFRFLLDNNIDYRTKAALRQVGFEALQLSDVGINKYATDPVIYNYADQHRLTIITKDKDFITLVQQHLASGILLIQQSRLESQSVVQAVQQLSTQYPSGIRGLAFAVSPAGVIPINLIPPPPKIIMGR